MKRRFAPFSFIPLPNSFARFPLDETHIDLIESVQVGGGGELVQSLKSALRSTQNSGTTRRSAPTVLALMLALCGTASVPAQQSNGGASTQKPPETSTQAGGTATPSKLAPSSTMTPAEARQAQLVADTQKLYELTEQLKAEVAKSNKDTLSLSVIKKADEVEKLARSLKERMRATPQP